MKKVVLLDLQGVRYAISASQVRSVRAAGAITRLSLSPEYLAGLTVVDGRTTVLVDLAVCLGLPPASGERPGQILIPAGREDLPAFLVEGEIHRRPVSAATGRPLSGFLPLPWLKGALLLDGLPLPLVDLKALLLTIQAGRWEAGAARLTPVPGRQRQLSRVRNFRLLTVGQKQYALPAADVRAGVATSPVVALGGLPPQVQGIAAAPAGVLPVICLDSLLGETPGQAGALLLAGEAGAQFLLSAARDHGELRAKALPLPPLAASAGITHALLSGGSIVPLIDLPALLAGSAPPSPLPESYSPALRQLDLGQRPLPVLEFGLLGNRQALPREHVEEVVALPPIRAIPGSSPLVAGVAEHQGELWPVIDLALYFGRTTTPGPDTRGILLRDRDFRALVLADALLGERLVPVESHRDLPLAIPHNLVFGCYLEEASVVLVLNVPALAMRFDPSLVPLFQGSVPVPIEVSPEEPECSCEPPPPPQAPVEPPSAEPRRQDTEAQQVSAPGAREEADEKEAVKEGRDALPTLSGPEPEPAPCAALLLMVEERPVPANPQFDLPLQVEEATPEASPAAGEAERKSPPEGEPPPVDAPLPPADAMESVEEEVAKSLPEPEDPAGAAAARGETAEEAAAPGQEAVAPPSRAEELEVAWAAPPPAPAAALHRRAMSPAEEAGENALSPDLDPAAAPLPKSWGRRTAAPLAALLALALAGLLWLQEAPQERAIPVSVSVPSFPPEPPGVPPPAQEKPDESTAMAAGGELRSPLTAEAEASAAPRPVEPAAAPSPVRLFGPYIVRRGDTLWEISASFTGNPFNFPRIARENEIRDPDRIYPGQQIAIGRVQGR